MEAERAKYSVMMMARLLEVSRQGSCQWVRRTSGRDEDPWARLRDAILAVWETSERIFGARQVPRSLPEEFDGTTLYRVRRIMRELGIEGVAPHRKKRTTIPDEDAPTRPDLVKRDFTSPVPTYRLVGDRVQEHARAERVIAEYVDRYNFRRLHSSFDYCTPAEWYFSGINSMNAPIDKMAKWAA